MIYSGNLFHIGNLSKGVCDDAQNEEIHFYGDVDHDAVDYFIALVCGEPNPEFCDDCDEEGHSLLAHQSMCYFLNYEHFAHHVAGPDDGDVPTIMPANFKFDNDIDDGVDICIMKVEGEGDVERIPCDCSNPREFMKNMLNKGMFFMLTNLLNEISH